MRNKTSTMLEQTLANLLLASAQKTNKDIDPQHTPLFAKLFKALMKVESEHASIFSKHLKITKPDLFDVEASTDGEANLQESHRREGVAIEAYKQFAEAATTPRAKEVFDALVEIEEDHLGLED